MEHGVVRRARVRAAVIDEVLIAATGVLVYAMAVQTGAAAVAALVLARLLRPLSPSQETVVAVLVAGTWLCVRLLYGVLAEGGPAGATPGKRLSGLAVVGPGGGAPGYRRALVRHAAKAALVASVVGLLAPATGHCWHDTAARTRVQPRPRPSSRRPRSSSG